MTPQSLSPCTNLVFASLHHLQHKYETPGRYINDEKRTNHKIKPYKSSNEKQAEREPNPQISCFHQIAVIKQVKNRYEIKH